MSEMCMWDVCLGVCGFVGDFECGMFLLCGIYQ